MGTLSSKNHILTYTDEAGVGGQTFVGFPTDFTEVGEKWSLAFSFAMQDMIPPIAVFPAFAAAIVGCAQAITQVLENAPMPMSPATGAAALDAGTTIIGAALASMIAPNLIAVPPAVAFSVFFNLEMSSLFAGTTDPVQPAEKTSNAIKSWLMQVQWTPPGTPAPQPITILPT